MSAQSPELQLKIQQWRQQCRDGTMSAEDYKQVILHLRGDRAKAAQPTAGSRVTKSRTAAAKKPDGDALLGELDAL